VAFAGIPTLFRSQTPELRRKKSEGEAEAPSAQAPLISGFWFLTSGLFRATVA
jgi:hypothetical protein